MKKLSLSIIFAFLCLTIHADEGMWMLQLLKQQQFAEMKKLGLKLQDYDIYNPNGASIKDAVVQFGRGCTGEVVSSQGLILTNHHCGYGSIQSHSTLKHNYLEDGFWAMSQKEELPNPGLTVTFIDKIEDVTDYVKQCLKRDKSEDKDGIFFLSPSYLNKIANEKVGKNFSKENKGMSVEIKAFFNGNQYIMFTKKIYSDIRLVGAPPSSIGKFGADTDNWMWPRHTGDFSVFRIYADRDGNPSDYSPNNIPLKPKRWLKISTKGVPEKGFAMILGFPGTTNKFYTSWEVVERRDIDNAVRINMREVRQKSMLEEMLKNEKVKIQYASKYSGSTNSYKSSIGSNWAIDKRNFVETKKKQQERLKNWAKNNNKNEYIDALETIKNIVEQRRNLRYRAAMLNEGILRGVEFSAVPTTNADSLMHALQNNNFKDIESIIPKLKKDFSLFANKNYDANVDKKVSKAVITEYVRLIPRNEQPDFFDTLYTKFNANIDEFVNYIFDKSIFGSKENFQTFLASMSAEKIASDPMMNFAKSAKKEYIKLRKELSSFNNSFDIARRTYLKGILEMDGKNTYAPDANLSLRLAYGQVKGYSPRDAVYYYPQSTMNGIMEKEDPNNWEFIVPQKLKKLYKNRDFGKYALQNGKMPIALMASTHTTGGNSGSPVMNANGELIGINFDRNWEGVGGDIQYLLDYQRSIIVDIRYVLFIIDKYAGAKHLIEEMEL